MLGQPTGDLQSRTAHVQQRTQRRQGLARVRRLEHQHVFGRVQDDRRHRLLFEPAARDLGQHRVRRACTVGRVRIERGGRVHCLNYRPKPSAIE